MATNATPYKAPDVTVAPTGLHSFVAPRGGAPLAGLAWAPREVVTNGPWTDTVGGMSSRPTGPDVKDPPESYPQYQQNSYIVLSKASEFQAVSTDPVSTVLGTDQLPPYQGVSLNDPRLRPPDSSRMLRSPDSYRFFRPFDVWAAKRLNGNHSSGVDTPRYQSGISIPSKGMQVNFPSRRNTVSSTPPPRDVMIMDSPSGMDVPNYTFQPSAQAPTGSAYRLG